MKKFILILFVGLSITTYGQFRDQNSNKPSIHEGIITSQPDLFLGFFNPDNFTMRHSYNLSYSAFGNNGMALGLYTNSMIYKLTENLNVEADISLMHSPYSTFGQEFQDNINGIYLSRAQINYKASDNFFITVQYRNIPSMYYSPYSYRMYDTPWYQRGPGNGFYLGK